MSGTDNSDASDSIPVVPVPSSGQEQTMVQPETPILQGMLLQVRTVWQCLLLHISFALSVPKLRKTTSIHKLIKLLAFDAVNLGLQMAVIPGGVMQLASDSALRL